MIAPLFILAGLVVVTWWDEAAVDSTTS